MAKRERVFEPWMPSSRNGVPLTAGTKYGRLTLVCPMREVPTKNIYWLCRCDCGNTTHVTPGKLRTGTTSSCGCYFSEVMRTSHPQLKHGHAAGGKLSPEYRIWSAMLERCSNPNSTSYSLYGGRGITVCNRWRGAFADFYSDMGPRPSPNHSIDRIDNNKGYSPDNCRWATSIEQMRNRRNVRWLDFRGERRPIPEWSEITGIKSATIHARIDRHNWTVEKALTTPTKTWNKNTA